MHFLKRKLYQVYLGYLSLKTGNDIHFSKIQYFLKNNKALNLDNPEEFAEKIQWLKLFYYDEKYKDYADKYEVRKFVEKKIGSDVLVPLVGVYNSVEDLDFEKLPQKVALKCSHGSGYNLIIKDKDAINQKKAKAQLAKFMSRNYYKKYREKVYKEIRPVIVAEQFLDQLENGEIIDYKFYCFHGSPKYILVKTKENGTFKKCFYDLNWNKVKPDSSTKNYLESEIPKPLNFDKMLEMATKLSEGFIFIRVDLYSIENKVYFGELTFFPNGGVRRLMIERLNKEFGDLMTLPKLT